MFCKILHWVVLFGLAQQMSSFFFPGWAEMGQTLFRFVDENYTPQLLTGQNWFGHCEPKHNFAPFEASNPRMLKWCMYSLTGLHSLTFLQIQQPRTSKMTHKTVATLILTELDECKGLSCKKRHSGNFSNCGKKQESHLPVPVFSCIFVLWPMHVLVRHVAPPNPFLLGQVSPGEDAWVLQHGMRLPKRHRKTLHTARCQSSSKTGDESHMQPASGKCSHINQVVW